MTLVEISKTLNSSIVPAIMGGDFTVNPNLDNICDVGTAINAMTADQFKTYLNEFAAAVKTYVDSRGYSPEELPLFVDSQEYGGIIQSIKSDTTETRDSHIYNLVDGQVYNDVNKFFGTAFNTKIYEKDTNWSIAKSIPNQMYKKCFDSPENVSRLVALIETWLDNTIRRNSSALEHNLISELGIKGKAINLVTMYNAMLTEGTVAQSKSTGTIGANATTWTDGEQVTVTSENCIYNRYFMEWARETIANITSAAKFMNKKYNDGTISTWQTRESSVCILNSIFKNRLNSLKLDSDFGGVNVDTPFWNAQTDSLVPTLKNSCRIIYNDGVVTAEPSAENNKTLDYVVGMYYDRYAVGYTMTPVSPRTSYNADGDFYTIFRDFNVRYWIDTRNTAIIFTLN